MVPETQRSESKFGVIINAQFMCSYTIKIVCNQKNFDPQKGTFLLDKICTCATEIYIHTKIANDLNLSDEFEQRQEQQKTALLKCYELLSYIELAKPIYNISDKRLTYWLGLVIRSKNEIKKWITSDKKRFKSNTIK